MAVKVAKRPAARTSAPNLSVGAPKVAKVVKAKALPPPEVEEAAPAELPEFGEFMMLKLDEITVSPDKYRDQESKKQDEDDVLAIAESIPDLGLMMPLIVRRSGDGYELISGRKRIKAADLAGMTEVPVIVKEYSEIESELGQLGENLLRANYRGAALDKANARYAALMKSIHPELAAKVAGGKARANQVAASKGRKVASAPKVKSPTKAIAEANNMSERGVQRSIKRGGTFTDQDFEIFRQNKVKKTHQDSIAAVSDPKKRVAIISLISDGMPIQEAIEKVTLPEGARVSKVEANGKDGAESDEEYLAKCPVRTQVANPAKFDCQALAYRRLIGAKTRLSDAFSAILKQFPDKSVRGGSTGYFGLVHRFLKMVSPAEWKLCGTCEGKGVHVPAGKSKEEDCKNCSKNGFICN